MRVWGRGAAALSGLMLLICLSALPGCEGEKDGPRKIVTPELLDDEIPEGAIPICGYLASASGLLRLDTDAYVPASERLIIAPGTQLRFGMGKGLYVLGSLEAIGTAEDSIRFGSDVSWRGIAVMGRLAAITLDRCRIEGATAGICIEDGRGTIARSTIQYCLAPVVEARGEARLVLTDSHVVGNGDLVAAKDEAVLDLKGNRFDVLSCCTAIRCWSSGDIHVDGNTFQGYGEAFAAVACNMKRSGRALLRENSFVSMNSYSSMYVGNGSVVDVESAASLTMEANRFRGVVGIHIRAREIASVDIAANVIEHGPFYEAVLTLIECSESSLTDSRCEGPAGYLGGGLLVAGGTAIVERCSWEHSRGLFQSSGRVTLSQCLFRHSLVTADSQVTMDNCVFTECDKAVAASGGVFRNCVFLDNESDMSVQPPGEVLLSGCILVNGEGRANITGWSGYEFLSLRLHYNLLDTGLDAIQLEGVHQIHETGVLSGDPGFDPQGPTIPLGDHLYTLTLLPGSPCRDAGPPESERNDLDGSRNDMGVCGGPADLRVLEVQP